MVCGDCCVLTEGGVETWAICVRCDRRKGNDLAARWRIVLTWLALLLVALVVLAALAVRLR